MNVNPAKSNIVHFRNPSVERSNFVFKIGDTQLNYVTQNKYLGRVLTEHLDYSISARTVAESANRALGMLIAKTKTFGGIPYEAFSKLYESTVVPVITYASSIWGCENFSCISAVQNRAARYFMNVGIHTPNAAVLGDVGWKPITYHCWKSELASWYRFSCMSHS